MPGYRELEILIFYLLASFLNRQPWFQGSLYMKNLLFAAYAIFNSGLTVGFSNLFCGYFQSFSLADAVHISHVIVAVFASALLGVVAPSLTPRTLPCSSRFSL
jgi:F0F1-type ATP synthase membrane subunit c/vacuolar-type H+-ATPase subunit K